MSNIPVATAVPLSSTYPGLAQVGHVAVPDKFGPCAITPELWGILERAETMTIRQHVKLLPKKCCGCPPCVVQENTYSIYAGMTRDDSYEILRADEVSDDWNRCCCKPFHPLRVELRQYFPIPGEGVQSDWSHLSQDVRNDWGSWTAGRRQEELRNLYKSQPVLVSIVRNNGQRCCCKWPCKWLSTFVCLECCQDGVQVVAGPVSDEIVDGKPKEVGRPLFIDPNRVIGKVTQPILGGYCTPTVHLSEGQNDATPFGKVQGPFIFGGWSEMCCDFNFPVSFFNSPDKRGDIALIKKIKPQSFGLAVTELLSDADVFTLQYNLNTKLTAEQKLTTLASQLLIDYMLFDGATNKCDQDDNAVYCHMFYCSCFGCLWPCDIIIPKNQSN